MQRASDGAELRAIVRSLRAHGAGRVAFVPTMGALHDGHLALVKTAREHADAVVVSIFVNPLQFGAGEDFSRYPRQIERDAALLESIGADLLFLPNVASLFPHGQEAQSRVEVPVLSDILCGASRPGHFVGVTTIVSKLFNLVQADLAVFGEKDFQQLAIIRRMVADLNFPLEIIGQPTTRETDGLAMSSRNAYLSDDERQRAPALYATLRLMAEQLRQRHHMGRSDIERLEAEGRAALLVSGFMPDYVAIRRADDLSEPDEGVGDENLVILAAARLGQTRLIDNIRVST
ncbi:MAG: pantoate--beta-alanine ligase [Gammaproteobacteria bacterium 28-57-27]|nr:MAG: pantoate--beta-alanine ligase [Gammaproteobacteria bacterium 28-57-27]